jgi:phage tail sheath protein FI
MAVSTYKHGVTWRDVPTSIISPITADSGIPVAVGASPIYESTTPAPINVPRIYYSYQEAVTEMGYSEDWKTYGLSEVIYNYFVLFNVGPIILINVFNPATTPKAPVLNQLTPVTNGQAIIVAKDILLSTLLVKHTSGTPTYTKDTDYTAAYNDAGDVVVTRIPTGAILGSVTQLSMSYTQADPSQIDKVEIIGGVDPTSGKNTGLQAVEDVFPALHIIPGIILCPGYSHDPAVAAVMAAKAELVNGCFRCITYVDIDSVATVKAQDVNAWKNTNNYVSNRMAAFWPRVSLDTRQSWMSTQAGALTELVDHANGEVPVESPSNKNLKMNKTVCGPVATPADVFFSKADADMLNGQGIVSSINWIGGWKLWGNNMTIYPSSSDVKDRWIPVRRMTDWIGNTIILTVYQFVDKPGNRRLIDSIIDSLNIWLNSLVASGNALGARVEFRHDENPDTELMAGHYKFHVFEAFPTPAEWIEFLIEFDVTYLEALFTPVTTQTPPAEV